MLGVPDVITDVYGDDIDLDRALERRETRK